MPPFAVCFANDNNNDESLQLSQDESSSDCLPPHPPPPPPLCKSLQDDDDDDDNYDRCNAKNDDDNGTTTAFFLSNDAAVGILPPSLPRQKKSVRFALDQNKVQVLEYDRQERAVLWASPREEHDRRQELHDTIRRLQETKVRNDNNDDDTMTLRGLEQWTSTRCFREKRQRLEIVRLSVLAEQEDLWDAPSFVREDAIATASRRASAYATRAALENAQKDAHHVEKVVPSGGE